MLYIALVKVYGEHCVYKKNVFCVLYLFCVAAHVTANTHELHTYIDTY